MASPLFMSKPWEINANRVLVISDVHQDIRWIKDVMEYEKGGFDRLLFNGDIIHSKLARKFIAGTRETARFYRSLVDTYDVNIGNHELPIMESWGPNSRFSHKRGVINPASGFTKSNSLHFNREMSAEAWAKVTIFRVVNGVLVSHAGFGWKDWYMGPNDFVIEKLWNESKEAFSHLSALPNDLFRVGPARSKPKHGRELLDPTELPGGPIWKDWESEFSEDFSIPQIVGHTAMNETVRRKGKAYNIDGEQTTYAIINRNGQIDFKGMKNGVPFTPTILNQTKKDPSKNDGSLN